MQGRSGFSKRHAVTAALMAGFCLASNGLALAWALLTDDPLMRRGWVILMIGICTVLFPVLTWGLFRVPRIAVQGVIATTTFLVAGAIYASGQADAPIAFLFLWAVPNTAAFLDTRQSLVQIGLAIAACGAALAGVHVRVHGQFGLGADEALRWAFVASTELAVAVLVMRMRIALRSSWTRLRQRAAQQATVSEIGQRALSHVALTPLLNETVGMVSETLAVELVTVLEYLPGEEQVLMRAGIGWPPGAIGSLKVPLDDSSQTATAIREQTPMVVEDYATEERFRGAQLLREQGAVSGIAVPIRGRETAFGVVAAHSRKRRHFSADDVNFLQSVANVLAATIERRITEAETRHQALHDPLTGLPNRALFRDRLQHALARSRRKDTTLAVLFLDVDNFKVVNDSLGHEAGDELLKVLAPRLAESVRVDDTVARFGGDEFVLLCEDVAEEEEAIEIAARVQQCFARPLQIAGAEHFVTASIGVALPTPGHDAPDTLLRDADAAMYQAKERGRARFEVFDADMRASAVRRLQVEADLRRAVENGEMRLVYQPAIDIDSGRIVAVEALLRWHHPQRGIVPPLDFIPVAEESGLIVPLGDWVLREAMTKGVRWRQMARPGEPPLVVSVNLSVRQLAERDLAASVARAIEDTGVDPRQIALEITESVLVKDTVAVAATLHALEALGVRLVLDDFGTGYSSLGYVKRFPLSFLKIDRSFVAELGTSGRDAAIVSAIAEMSRALGARVVAEGVETEEQLRGARKLGCELAQGYLFSRPVPPDEIDGLLRTDPWRLITISG
ncbi:MAG TPA: bifunctional diguanylate cyclase/phosphodiesterase [Thermoleophilaceae bacterium]